MSEAVTPLRMSRQAASDCLRDVHGVVRSASTLAKDAVNGTGPAFQRLGNAALYRPADLDAWVEANVSTPVFKNSEAKHDLRRGK